MADLPSTLILGTGAMASLFGARLARAGARVTLAGTWGDALREISHRGVNVEEEGATWSAPAATAYLTDPLPPAELVLVLVKSHQTSRVAPHAARALAAGGVIISLQNGLGNRELLLQAAPERVTVGVTSLGATLLGPGRVRAGGQGTTVLGTQPALATAVERAANLLRQAGMQTKVAGQIEPHVWRKLAVNCAINPLSALLWVPNGRLLEAPWDRVMELAAAEVGAVATVQGIDLGADPAELARQVASQTAANRSSMLQDLERGGQTEIDAINGAVVRLGRRHGVPTPVNESLWRAVRSQEGRPLAGFAAPLEAEAPWLEALLRLGQSGSRSQTFSPGSLTATN